MTTQRQSPFARAFIAANRVFGFLAALGGVYLLGIFVLALFRGRSFADSWVVGAFGAVSLAAGILYMRAAPTRASSQKGPNL
jgi:uncharacterized membrane protein